MSWRYRAIKRDVDLDTHLVVFFYKSFTASPVEIPILSLTEVNGFEAMPHGVANDCYIEIELARAAVGDTAWTRIQGDYDIAVWLVTGDPERSTIPLDDIIYSNVYRARSVRPRERTIAESANEEIIKFVAPHYWKSIGEQHPPLGVPGAVVATHVVASGLPIRKKCVRTGPFLLDVADTPDYPYLFGLLKRLPDNTVLSRVDGYIWGWAFDGFSPDGYPAFATLKFKYENLWIVLDDKNNNSGLNGALEFKNTWELFTAYLELWDLRFIPSAATVVPTFTTFEERQDIDPLDLAGYFAEHTIDSKDSEFTVSQATVAYNPIPAHQNLTSEVIVNNPNGATATQLTVSIKTPWHHDLTFTETWKDGGDNDAMEIIFGDTRPAADLHAFIRVTDDDELLAVHLLDSTTVVGTLSDGTEVTDNGDWIPYGVDSTDLNFARVVFWVARNGYSRVLAERLMNRHKNQANKIEGVLRGHWLHRVGTRCTAGSLLSEFTITRAEYSAETNTTKFTGELQQ